VWEAVLLHRTAKRRSFVQKMAGGTEKPNPPDHRDKQSVVDTEYEFDQLDKGKAQHDFIPQIVSSTLSVISNRQYEDQSTGKAGNQVQPGGIVFLKKERRY
jgi:hypothetical protein